MIPGQRAGIPHASWPKNQNIKQKQYNKFNKDKKMVHIKKIFKKNNNLKHRRSIGEITMRADLIKEDLK